MAKKASLSLSVNAIVVLILAVVMLGLGLAFVNNLFGQAQTNLEQMLAQEQDAPSATSSRPITVSRGAIITTAGVEETLKMNIYNPTNADWGTPPRCIPNSLLVNIDDTLNGNANTYCAAGCEHVDGGDVNKFDGDTCTANPAATACPMVSTLFDEGNALDDMVSNNFRKSVCLAASCTFRDGTGVGQPAIAANDECLSEADGVSPDISCATGTGFTLDSTQTLAKPVPSGASEEFGVVMKMPRIAPGTYLCKVSIKSYQKDFTIKIES